MQDLDEGRGGELQLCYYYTTDPRACGSSILRTGGGSWLVVRADRAKGGETALFVSLDHCSGGTRLNTQGARYIVNACLEAPELKECGMSCHSLRHRAATWAQVGTRCKDRRHLGLVGACLRRHDARLSEDRRKGAREPGQVPRGDAGIERPAGRGAPGGPTGQPLPSALCGKWPTAKTSMAPFAKGARAPCTHMAQRMHSLRGAQLSHGTWSCGTGQRDNAEAEREHTRRRPPLAACPLCLDRPRSRPEHPPSPFLPIWGFMSEAAARTFPCQAVKAVHQRARDALLAQRRQRCASCATMPGEPTNAVRLHLALVVAIVATWQG